jgi:hypothetical protein
VKRVTGDNDEGQRLYSEYRRDLLARQLSNSENFDRSILSLSSAALGFSISFIKDIVPLKSATHLCLLHSSWILFALSIVATLSSLIVSQFAIDKQLIFAEQYYLEKREEFLTRRNPFALVTVWLNRVAGALFIAGIGLTVVFAVLNTY